MGNGTKLNLVFKMPLEQDGRLTELAAVPVLHTDHNQLDSNNDGFIAANEVGNFEKWMKDNYFPTLQQYTVVTTDEELIGDYQYIQGLFGYLTQHNYGLYHIGLHEADLGKTVKYLSCGGDPFAAVRADYLERQKVINLFTRELIKRTLNDDPTDDLTDLSFDKLTDQMYLQELNPINEPKNTSTFELATIIQNIDNGSLLIQELGLYDYAYMLQQEPSKQAELLTLWGLKLANLSIDATTHTPDLDVKYIPFLNDSRRPQAGSSCYHWTASLFDVPNFNAAHAIFMDAQACEKLNVTIDDSTARIASTITGAQGGVSDKFLNIFGWGMANINPYTEEGLAFNFMRSIVYGAGLLAVYKFGLRKLAPVFTRLKNFALKLINKAPQTATVVEAATETATVPSKWAKFKAWLAPGLTAAKSGYDILTAWLAGTAINDYFKLSLYTELLEPKLSPDVAAEDDADSEPANDK